MRHLECNFQFLNLMVAKHKASLTYSFYLCFEEFNLKLDPKYRLQFPFNYRVIGFKTRWNIVLPFYRIRLRIFCCTIKRSRRNSQDNVHWILNPINRLRYTNFSTNSKSVKNESDGYLRIKIWFFDVHRVVKPVGGAKIPWSTNRFL